MKRALIAGTFVVLCGLPASAGVVYVDADRAGGAGTYEKPFATIAEAERTAGMAGIIFVAQATRPYEENVALSKGQMLIGSAYGLDAVRDELHVSIQAPPLPAADGTGPVIHGNVSLAGDNVVAGLTITADKKTGAALTAEMPQGELTVRKLWIQTTGDVYGFYVGQSAFPTTWTVGGLTAAEGGAGLLIEGGQGNVTLDHVAIAGSFASGIEINNRTGGTVAFRNASTVKISDVSRAGVSITACAGAVRFESPLQVRTTGGRGFIVNRVGTLAVTGGSSWIEAMNGAALDVRSATTDVVLNHVSATGIAPGRVTDAIVIEKTHGRFEITGDEGQAGSGGAVVNALSYGVRVAQSTGVRIRNMRISGGGAVASAEECGADVPKQTNLRCRAGLYLRHVERSTFENLTVEDNSGVGLNANNLIDTTFADVRINRTGDQATEPALLIDEARGAITFTRCAFLDGGGGAIVLEQRFNAAKITFERCEIGAPQRPASVPDLVRGHTGGQARLDLQFVNTNIHDNAGGAIAFSAGDAATATLTIRDSHLDRFGSSAVVVTGSGTAHVSTVISGSQIAAPGAAGLPLIDLGLAGSSGCVDIAQNVLTGGNPAIRARGPQLRIVGGAATLSQRNGGASVDIDPSATGVTDACQ